MGEVKMQLFKFIERYRNFNKVVHQIELSESISTSAYLRHERAAVNNKSTVSSYEKRKSEYYKGEKEAYANTLKIIKEYMKTGEIEENNDIPTT